MQGLKPVGNKVIMSVLATIKVYKVIIEEQKL